MSRAELERLAEKSGKFSCLKIEIHRRSSRGNSGCGFGKSGKLLGCVVVQLDLKSILENNGNCRASAIQNGWVWIGGSDVKLHLNVRAEPDPRFVFRFDGEPECSPQVFQVNGNVKQPVFTCKFSFRNSGERTLRSRSSLSEPSTSTSCFSSGASDNEQPLKERKGWHRQVSRSNPGAWLILRPGHGTWKPWGRLEAWRERSSGDHLGYRFDLIPDGGIDTIPLANSSISTKTGGKFSIDITTGPTPMTSPNSSFDLSSGSGSGSDLGSTSGSGSWAHLVQRIRDVVHGGG
ncbi:UNVERIFIED_CONTAM: hypothetical protein Scaly_1381300 [Sesamum calycinum]|uniref:Uncharacterized protein n=1 Tax=Sesamum calycinum TaxID=2727403 RepID=A0AAW2PN26_9LAMI